MSFKTPLWRRQFNLLLLALPSLLAPLKAQSQSQSQSPAPIPSSLSVSPRRARATPQDGEGPFYPKHWEGELDSDLLNFNGKVYVNGTPMTLSGRLFSTEGEPLVGAAVELWQCDEIGDYRHPRSAGEAPAQRGFQGFGRMVSGGDGGYSFRTLKPVPYNGRAAHIHFKIVAPGYRTLTTQMYFPGESEEGTFLMRAYKALGGFSKHRDLLTATAETLRVGEREEVRARFDMVLDRA
jgi:protocatechuate 3,4-dioxygenase, beta subunit